MTRIVALSDSHTASVTSLPAPLREALAGADLIIHAGDHTESTLLHELKQFGEVVAVAGNMDSTAIKVALPTRQLITVGGRTLGIAHGSGAPGGIEHRVRKLFPENPDLIVFGHSHVAYIGTVDGSLMVNPGPASKGYALVEIDGDIRARTIRL